MLRSAPAREALALLSLLSAASAQYAEQQKLVASDGAPFDEFATTVAISGDTAVAGAPGADSTSSGPDTGAAYVFHAVGTTWAEEQVLIASDAELDDEFGNAVAIWDDTIVVGARFVDDNGDNAGAAYVFVREHGSWRERQKLLAFDGEAFDGFGAVVAIWGDTIAVGAPLDSNPVFEAGSVYVFVRSGAAWTLQQKLVASDAALRDLFGAALSVDGDSIAVGARLKVGGSNWEGAAYVFTRAGSTWTEQQKLTAFDAANGDQFGTSVSISEDTLAVGSFRDDDAGLDSGSAYVYTRAGSAWSLQQKLVGSTTAADDEFGNAIGIAGDRLLVGAHDAVVGIVRRGTAYVFERRDAIWTEAQQLNSNDPPSDGGAFGGSVSVSGDRMIVGDVRDQAWGQNSGAAHVFAAAEPGIASCFGTACPCANDDPSAGCANSTGAGGSLGGTGSPAVSEDDLVLHATQLPPHRLALFVVSSERGSTLVFNGIQCTAKPMIRYTGQLQSSGAAGAATLVHPVADSGGFITAGATRYFQVVYRDSVHPPCVTGGNWTNLYAVTFTP